MNWFFGKRKKEKPPVPSVVKSSEKAYEVEACSLGTELASAITRCVQSAHAVAVMKHKVEELRARVEEQERNKQALLDRCERELWTERMPPSRFPCD